MFSITKTERITMQTAAQEMIKAIKARKAEYDKAGSRTYMAEHYEKEAEQWAERFGATIEWHCVHPSIHVNGSEISFADFCMVVY
jgi:hypothetical protein